MTNLLFNLKAVQTGSYKAEVGAGAGAETNSFRLHNTDFKEFYCRGVMINDKKNHPYHSTIQPLILFYPQFPSQYLFFHYP
jgi:hypothetical protein